MGNGAPPGKAHLDFLDGMRGLAALYVVLHHCWLTAYPVAADSGSCGICRAAPSWTFILAWGQLAVAIFIVISGFSLALAAARVSQDFGTYITRRAFRIIPPYWMALALSCLVIVWLTQPYNGTVVNAESIIVHALLVQNVVDTPKPNGAFWSIAVEWQIYFVFPAILLSCRRLGVAAMIFGVTTLVALVYLVGSQYDLIAKLLGLDPTVLAPLSKLLYLRPQFLALFAMGVAAACILTGEASRGGLPWRDLGVALLAITLCILVLTPTDLVERSFFWVDLLAGAATASFLAGFARQPGATTSRLLGSRVPRWLGESSYSLYLIHVPILETIYYVVLVPYVGSQHARFAWLVALTVPISALAARGFWRWFELPFMKSRSFGELFGRVGKAT